jgi:hypothetical protein
MSDVWQPFLLDDLPPVTRPEVEEGAALRERFEAFHATNPHVYSRLRDMALHSRRRGVRRYGIAALYEKLRYDTAVQTVVSGGMADSYKLGNSYRAFYARAMKSFGKLEKRQRLIMRKLDIREDDE